MVCQLFRIGSIISIKNIKIFDDSTHAVVVYLCPSHLPFPPVSGAAGLR